MIKPEDERLHRYFDGELSPEEAAAFEEQMTDDDRLKLAALAEVRGLTAMALDAEAANVDLWPAIEKQIAASARRRPWHAFARRLSYGGAALAAAAVLFVVFHPAAGHVGNNECDVEELESDGASTTVLRMPDPGQDSTTTLIWTEEES